MRPPTTLPGDFVIRGGGDEFASRQKQIFERLTQATKEFNKYVSCSSLSETEMELLRGRGVTMGRRRTLAKQNRNETTQYRGKESIFKRPEGPAPLAARKTVPDHHKNPHKWIKYSLEDVQNEQMSDRSNAQAAFSFLKELRARKATEREKNEEMNVQCQEPESSLLSSSRCKFTTHIPFRKMSKSKATNEAVVVEHDDRPVYRNSKIILPEYVVGQKQEKKIKRASTVIKVDRSKQLKLDHLEELDE